MRGSLLWIGTCAALGGCRVDGVYDAGGLLCGAAAGACPDGWDCASPSLPLQPFCEPATCEGPWSACRQPDLNAGFIPSNPATKPLSCHCSLDCPCPMVCVADPRLSFPLSDGGVCERVCEDGSACTAESAADKCGPLSSATPDAGIVDVCEVGQCDGGKTSCGPVDAGAVCGSNGLCIPGA